MPTSTPSTADILRRLLDADQDLPPEYNNGFGNHLPMALQALQAMGADTLRLQQFRTAYGQHFKGQPRLLAEAPTTDWQSLRGHGDAAYGPLRSHFAQALADVGMAATLRQALPDLLPGITAAAFHGLIRTAHAVEAEHHGELASGLAYWAARWQGLTPARVAGPLLDFENWAAQLVADAPTTSVNGPLISVRIEAALQTPAYQRLGAALSPQNELPQLLRRLAGLALERYLVSRNFTVLHMITGLRALRVLLPWVEVEMPLAQAILVQAFTAAYLAARVLPLATPLTEPSEQVSLSWPLLCRAATESDDEHVVKLVHACREEAAFYGDPRYLSAATLVLGAAARTKHLLPR
ncbi:questin oxidase family protein [Roseateles koreensis]|uniref:Questin oxidase family protein n=1 Tax=Roseateles koreensis TaxID=2987526 RepID=A0ABT5KT83_9BURK|nr:questin oxidase family protein [Roseateles koreensis]MDC8784987.1 questin oxidase family protein [Roseateles koreensis]